MPSRAVITLLALHFLATCAETAFARPEPPVIAPSEALSPEDERKAFTVPSGFEVQLVASEPDIQKPIQMAFDARGRLWVTTSYHYPFAAPPGEAHDRLYILSDFDPITGKARKVQVFADDLNIPIGILPLPDCNSCIVSSVGEIRKYTDTQGTGHADKMEVLFTGFGSRDTHGMYNSYTYMPDGWVYACHGYLNTSRVKGKDGHEVEMNSGNTFRFRPDGSRIEVYTRGQVNPFGIAVDPWLNLYTADCHSKPITQLIPGAYYDSFGKPHDGLGYAPHVVHHDHGSTALCGLTWYDADQFPKEYVGTMFLGNVVTNRINFDRIAWKGATPVGIEQPDFLVSKDPWFRPVDIKLAPDGTLFVSDFYNKIIGHYEVDLKHPQRDKNRGRIWRIVWKGQDGKSATPRKPSDDLTAETVEKLGGLIASPNMTVRLQATQEINRRSGHANPVLPISHLKNQDSVVVWFQTLSDRSQLPPEYQAMLAATLADHARLYEKQDLKNANQSEPLPISQSLMVLVKATIFRPHADNVPSLIQILRKCPPEDTHLRQAARIALRNCLRDDDRSWPPFDNAELLKKGFDPIYAEIAVAVPTRKAAQYLVSQMALLQKQSPPDWLPAAAGHMARYGDDLATALRLLTEVPYSPVVGEAILSFLRVMQSRALPLEDNLRTLVLRRLERELAPAPGKTDDFSPEAVRKSVSVAKVLSALPALITTWNQVQPDSRTVETLGHWVGNSRSPADLRTAAAEALIKAFPQQGVCIILQACADPSIPVALREQMLLMMASSTNQDARLDARDALVAAPYRLSLAIGTALASSPAGAEELLDAIKKGKAPARLLQEQAIVERLHGAKIADMDKRIAELTKGLHAPDQRLADLIKRRAGGYVAAMPDKELGAKLFSKHCGACHRIADQGGKIAPQLDGIGVRGLERLLEDVLDPNRNVDLAFRARVITTKDDRTITGLMLRVDGEVLIIADNEGKELRIPTRDIETNRETMLSPMPANFGDVIPESDFYHLMAYLLDQRAKDKK